MGNDQPKVGTIVRVKAGSKHAGQVGEIIKTGWHGFTVQFYNESIRNTETYKANELEEIKAHK